MYFPRFIRRTTILPVTDYDRQNTNQYNDNTKILHPIYLTVKLSFLNENAKACEDRYYSLFSQAFHFAVLHYLYEEVNVSVDLRSSLTLGPIDVVRNAVRTYMPLAPLGLALTIASTIDDKLPSNFSGSKLIFPTTT